MEINGLESKKTTEKKLMKWRAGSLKINKIDKPPCRHTKEKREKAQISKIRIIKEEVKIDTTEIWRLCKDTMKGYTPLNWIT